MKQTAERTRFELVIPFRGIHAFQACLFNHSSTSPSDFGVQRYGKFARFPNPEEKSLPQKRIVWLRTKCKTRESFEIEDEPISFRNLSKHMHLPHICRYVFSTGDTAQSCNRTKNKGHKLFLHSLRFLLPRVSQKTSQLRASLE